MRLITITIIAIAFLPLTAWGDRWEVETIDTWDNYYGGSMSFTLDNSENPHISYVTSLEGEGEYLKYAYYSGGSWVITPLYPGPGSFGYTTIDSDSMGNIGISYSYSQGGNEGHFTYAYWDGASWTISDIDSDTHFIQGTFSFDYLDRPHAVYRLTNPDELRYATFDGTDWVIETVDTGNMECSSVTSIGVDSSGIPHIIFFDIPDDYNAKLVYGYKNGLDWVFSTVDDNLTYATEAKNCSLVFDSNGVPYALYSYGDYYGESAYLKLSKKVGDNWALMFSNGTGGDSPYFVGSSDIDSDDRPHIVYKRYGDWKGANNLKNNTFLIYCYWDGSSWQYGPEPPGAGVLRLDSNNLLRIAYIEYTKKYGYPPIFDLNYAKWVYAPADFDLIWPSDKGQVSGDLIFDWEDAPSGSGGVTYDLWYSTNADFDPAEVVPNIAESTYTIPEGTLALNEFYFWKIRAWDGEYETWCGGDFWQFYYTSGGSGGRTIPKVFSLSSAYPNPSDGNVNFAFGLPYDCEVELGIFDVKGRLVTRLAEGDYEAGIYKKKVEGLRPGVYFYRLKTDDFTDTKSLVVK